VAEADLGPVKDLATLLGAARMMTSWYFILVVAMRLDPAAVLLFAATGGEAVDAGKRPGGLDTTIRQIEAAVERATSKAG
jgi:hypothetical protein